MTYSNPEFTTERYQGDSKRIVKCDLANTKPCGNLLSTYHVPKNYPTHDFTSVVIASHTTSAINAGGITRAVFYDRNGLPARQRDQIGYIDRNIPCGDTASFRWRLLSIDGVHAWFPYKASSTYQRVDSPSNPQPNCD